MRDDRDEALDRRSRILDGARAAFLRFGFERASIADIATGAGVSRTAVYLCVPKTLSELMTRWNRLSWRNDRAALFRSGRPGLAIQVEVAA
jgi:Bacterial regulatory proteins, tetR family